MIDKELEETIREVEEERRQKEFIENVNKKLDRLVGAQEEAKLNDKAKEFKKKTMKNHIITRLKSIDNMSVWMYYINNRRDKMRDVKEPEIRRAEIMDAAMLLFIEQGYTNTTTQDIVDKVNISRGLLYYHFKNKEDILYCLVEQYSDKLLKDIHVIVYDEGKTAVEKIRAFIDATIISSENISAEGTELQKTVDLEENRYMIDKLSHKIIEKLTIYFERIINQGISEKTLFVKYPSETAEFLMTAYVFVSNNISIRYSKKESVNEYLNAFKIMLEQSLNAKKLFSN